MQTTGTPRSPGEGIRVLIVDDEKSHAEVVGEALERQGYEISLATSGNAGGRQIDQEDFDIILTDLRMSDLGGMEILKKARQIQPDCEVLVITGHGDVKTAVEAIKRGASGFLLKPITVESIQAALDDILED